MRNILLSFFLLLSLSYGFIISTKSPNLKQIVGFRTHKRIPMRTAKFLSFNANLNTLHPIKFKVDTSDFKNAEKSDEVAQKVFLILNDILPKSLQFVSSLLKVPKRLTPLKLPYSARKCGRDYTIPEEYLKAELEADFLLFTKVFRDKTKRSAELGEVCFIDAFNGNRPIAGIIEFNLEYIFTGVQNRIPQIMSSIHSILRILAFSAELYPYYIDVNGKPQKEVLKKDFNVKGQLRNLIVSPKVLAESRKHFDCETFPGMLLEDKVDFGHDYDHWEMELMQGELFTKQHINKGSISKISIAIFEDSGWYVPDYSKAMHFKFGKGRGCNFLFGCNDKDHKFPEFCYKENEKKCMPNGESIGTCKDGDDHLGCKQLSHFRSESCDKGSKCVTTEIGGKVVYNCQFAFCSPDGSIIFTIGDKIIRCKENGKKLPISQGESLICPSVKKFCAPPPCGDKCGKNGVCLNEICLCDKDYTGRHCDQKKGISQF